MEKADETTNVGGESTIIDLGKDLSIQGGVEMNNATWLEGSSVIFWRTEYCNRLSDIHSRSVDIGGF